MNILLHSNQYCRRGDSVNARTLARGLRSQLGINSIICAPSSGANELDAITSLRTDGNKVIIYKDQHDLQDIARENKISHAYFMKSGAYDSVYVEGVPNIVHSVFRIWEPHGDFYSYNSDWTFLNVVKPNWLKWCSRYPRWLKIKLRSGNPYFPRWNLTPTCMPHIVSMSAPEPGFNFRESIGLSKDAKLVCRIGGYDDFDDPAGAGAVTSIVNTSNNIFFVFINTRKFCMHPRVLHIDRYITEPQKRAIIDSADLMLNCRLRGESFGYSICESLYCGTPVIGPSVSRNAVMDAHHVKMLGSHDLLYNSIDDLKYKILTNLESPPSPRDLQAIVEPFSEKHIIEQFYRTYLTGPKMPVSH